MIKSRRMRWTSHVVRKEEKRMLIGYRWENQKERDHYEDLNIRGWTILKWLLEK
jgi:hypothetical protein